LKLHEAIIKVLKENPDGLTTTQIAKKINDEGLYGRKDGEPVPATQISARISRPNYVRSFEKKGNLVLLR
jgi:hypothetical protein